MSLIPDFEIGLWNAWIPAIALLLHSIVPGLFKGFSRKMGRGDEGSRGGTPIMLYFYFLIILTVFLPLKTGTAWLYAGLCLYLLGLGIGIGAFAVAASTPSGQPFTKGVYRYSRNPIYLSVLILFVSIGVAAASWVYLLLVAIWAIWMQFVVLAEERITLKKFGEAYREYMNRTPRWLGLPKHG